MPRTRRAAAPEAAADTQAGPEAQATPDTSTPAADATAQPARRRAPRKKDTDAAAAAPAVPETAAPEAPAAEAPKKRRGRRAKAAAPEESATQVAPPPEPPAPEPAAPEAEATPRRRGRARKSPATEQAVAPETPEQLAAAEAVPVEEAAPRPRRGGRRPRGAAETPPENAVTPTEAPAEETPAAAETQAETGAPVRRRRSRRRRSDASEETPAVTVEIAPAVETDAAPATEAAETDETGARRPRRSRRSRRRRGVVEGSEILLEGEPLPLLESGELPLTDDDEAEAEEEIIVFPPPAPPVYAAPPLVPAVLSPAAGAPLPRATASVQRRDDGGLAQIVVNGTPRAPYFFFVNAETATDGDVVDAEIRAAGVAGIHLYSGVMYLPLKNAYGDRSFGAIDAFVQQVLTADPDGFLMPRLQFVPTNYWVRTHAEQLARYADGTEGDVSLASTEFWADCVDALEALIAHFSDPRTPGGDRVIGFHLDRGEWFYEVGSGYDTSGPNRTAFQNWLHAKYQMTYALRAAWYDGQVTFEDAEIPAWPGPSAVSKKGETPLYSSPRDGRWIDYAQYSSDLAAQVILGLADAVKTLSDNRLLVAVSYGYTLEFASRNDSGHLAMGAVLAAPQIDIVAGPNAYHGRGAGSPSPFGALVDSVTLHGKLFVVEDDTKTFLAQTPTEDVYNPKIASGADTQAIHQRHFGAALAHGAGVSWMDLWGQGWLDSPDIWRELGGLRDQEVIWNTLARGREAAPDVAVLVDEASLAYIKNDAAGLGANLVGKTRDLLMRSGASVGFYLQSDLPREDFPDSTLFLFLNALRVTTAERHAIRERLQRPGKTLAWLYAPGLFDEKGAASPEVGEIVGIALRLQPWDSRVGSHLTDTRHPITERLRGGKRIGQEEVLNPSYAVTDPQATVLAEYIANGAPSLAVREHPGGWKSVFFGDPDLTVELLRGLFTYAGVSLYDTQDDVVAASGDGILLVHAPFTGQRTLTLPRRATVYDATERKIIAVDTNSFRVFLRARTTRLFFWGEADAISAATGLEIPRPSRTSSQPQELEPVQGDSETGGETPAVLTETAVSETVTEEEDTESQAPRSRWQRRRAAARARREAERTAQTPDGSPDRGNAANPPMDIAELLPDLPPRRLAPSDDSEQEL